MKKFNKDKKSFKKEPLDLMEHKELAKDLRKAQEVLEPWMERFYHAYSVNGKECKEIKKALNLLSSKICCTQDNHWYALEESKTEGNNTPYYGSGKCAWI